MTVRALSITQLYPGMATGAQGVFIHQRLRSLPAELEVHVWRARPWFFGRGPKAPPKQETVDGIPVEDVPFFYLPGMLKGRDGKFLLRALRRRARPSLDVLDAHFAFPAGWAAVRFGQELGVPVVVTLRGTEVPYARDAARRPFIAECVRSAHRIIAVSGSLAQLALDMGAPSHRVRVVGNGIDATLFSPGDRGAARHRLGVPEDAKVLLTVGGLTERKGVARLLEVLPDLAERHPRVHYLVAGGGGPEGDQRGRLETMAAALGVRERVQFLGLVPFRDLPTVYRAADVFVLPTRNEGWANALQEAMACGLPVVTTDVGGNRQVLGGGEHGLLVPFGDPKALLDATLAAFEGHVDTDASTVFARARTWDVVGRETADVLLEAVADKARVGR